MKKQITALMQKLKTQRKTNPLSDPPLNAHYQFPPKMGRKRLGTIKR